MSTLAGIFRIDTIIRCLYNIIFRLEDIILCVPVDISVIFENMVWDLSGSVPKVFRSPGNPMILVIRFIFISICHLLNRLLDCLLNCLLDYYRALILRCGLRKWTFPVTVMVLLKMELPGHCYGSSKN